MADQILFDRLRYIDRLTQAGVGQDQARAHADALDEALRDAVATKSDIAEVKNAVQSDIAAVKNDIAEVKNAIQLAVRDMTIRTGATAMALFAALAAIKYF
ncbi:MAG: hypothetical protein JO288_21000 [Hyphomicrobiales bacterium]|nr:hypothetical protein [Hyphomicrobiales bacterium]